MDPYIQMLAWLAIIALVFLGLIAIGRSIDDDEDLD